MLGRGVCFDATTDHAGELGVVLDLEALLSDDTSVSIANGLSSV
jgi:hypothetical protein